MNPGGVAWPGLYREKEYMLSIMECGDMFVLIDGGDDSASIEWREMRNAGVREIPKKNSMTGSTSQVSVIT